MVLDDERLKATIRIDDKQALKDLDKILKEIQKALGKAKGKWNFSDFLLGDEGKLNVNMVKHLQKVKAAQDLAEDNREKNDKMRQVREVRDFKTFLARRKVMWADHERNRINKEKHDRLKVERDIIRRIKGMYQQMGEGVLDQSRVYSPGTVGHRAQTRFRRSQAAQEKYRVQGAGNKLYTFMSRLQQGIGVGPNKDDSAYDTQKKAAQFQRKMNPYQTSIDKAGKGIMGKIPTLVKIAGFSLGVGGIAQFGKMVVDSSPLLQAMLKIVRTGFTFILRPIGDMMGLIIRPLAILMLRHAVQFYKGSIKLFPMWSALGDLLIGDKTPKEVGELVADTGLETVKEASGEGDFLKTVWGIQLIRFGHELELLNKVINGVVGLWDLGNPSKFTAEAFKDPNVGPGSTGQDIYDTMSKWWQFQQESVLGPGMHGPLQGRGVVGAGKQYSTTLSEAIGLGDTIGSKSSKSHNVTLSESLGLGDTMDNKANLIPEPLRKYYAYLDKYGGGGKIGSARGIETNSEYSPYANPDHETGGYGGGYSNKARQLGYDRLQGVLGINSDTTPEDLENDVNDAMDSIQGQWDNAEDIMKLINAGAITGINNATKSSLRHMIASKNNFDDIESYTDSMGEGMAAAWEKMSRILKKLSIRGAQNDATNAQKTSGATEALEEVGSEIIVGGVKEVSGFHLEGLPGSKHYPTPSQALANNPPGSTVVDAADTSRRFRLGDDGKIEQYAKGGILTEPVFGFGQKTGKKYLLGESGPEAVVPLTGRGSGIGGGGSTVINLTVNGIRDTNEFVSVVMPQIKKLLKDDQSRRGIL